MKVATGSFTGNGTSQSISGLGFEPKFVLIKINDEAAVITADIMGPDSSKDTANGALFADGITSLDADGFSVGGDALVNANAATCYYIAIGGNRFATGTYVGDEVDNREITGVGFNPDLVLVWCTEDNPRWATTASGEIGTLLGNSAASPLDGDTIQEFIEDGFEIGESESVNEVGITFYWLALKRQAGRFLDLSYTGNGADDRSISGYGFEPTFAYTCRTSANGDSTLRMNGQVGDSSFANFNGDAQGNRIQAFEADGIQVGTSNGSNANGGTYGSWAFADGLTETPEDVVDDVIPDSILGGPHIVSQFRPVVY